MHYGDYLTFADTQRFHTSALLPTNYKAAYNTINRNFSYTLGQYTLRFGHIILSEELSPVVDVIWWKRLNALRGLLSKD